MKKVSPLRTVIGGVAALVVAMGIGRFAYTPILPIMENAQLFSERVAGYLASANFFGYLVGAILASLLKWKKGKQFYLFVYLLVSVVTTLVMGLTSDMYQWFGLRFVSGLASGLVFVFASSIVMDTLAYYKRVTWTGIFYSGVGIGIFITGIFVPLFSRHYQWQGAWIGIGLVALVVCLLAIVLVKEVPQVEKQPSVSIETNKQSNIRRPYLKYLFASYGCEGVGYIVSATFLVALVEKIPSLSDVPAISWVIVGLAAAPSCYIWSLLASRWGNLRMLQLAYFIQVIGVLLPAVFFNATGALLGAFLFGITFMGITTLFMAEVRSLVPFESSQMIGYFTFIYGIGQMIGPSVAGILIAKSGNYHSALYFAAATLVLGMIFLAIVQIHMNKEQKIIDQLEKGII